MKKLSAIAGILVVAGCVGAVALAVTQQKAAPARIAGPNGPTEKAITAEALAWFQAGVRLDAAAFSSYYAPDASLFPPNQPMVSGQPRIAAFWGEFFKQPGLAFSGGPAHIEAAKSGDLAYERGTFQLKVNGPDGKPATSVGKYVVVWKKQPEGKWKAYADIFNADQ